MNIPRLILCATTVFVLSSASASPVELKWDLNKGDRIEIVRTAQVQYLINNALNKVYEERNIVDLTAADNNKTAVAVKGTFQVYHRDSGQSVFHLREKHDSEFSIQPDGVFLVPEKIYMPNFRSVPAFPRKKMKPGDTWTKNGELVFNNFSRPFKLHFPVTYTLVSIEKKDTGDEAVIKYFFKIKKDLRGQKLPADFPVVITGRYEGTIIWGIESHRPLDMKDIYTIKFLMRTGRAASSVIEFRMNIQSDHKLYRAVTKKEKNKALDELKKEVPKDSGIEVDTDKRGLVLRMGEVLFDTDSARLRPEAQKNLDAIIALLKEKYPDREIIIEGHTDSRGGRAYNSRLSTSRARSVAEYVKKKGFHDKLSYRGLGPDKPLQSNITAAGRQKNRRVELIIKLH